MKQYRERGMEKYWDACKGLLHGHAVGGTFDMSAGEVDEMRQK